MIKLLSFNGTHMFGCSDSLWTKTPYLDLAGLATWIHVMVTLRIDYCNALYGAMPLKAIQKLQFSKKKKIIWFTKELDSEGKFLKMKT